MIDFLIWGQTTLRICLSVCSIIGIFHPAISKTDVAGVIVGETCWGGLFWAWFELLETRAGGGITCWFWTGFWATTGWFWALLAPFLVT